MDKKELEQNYFGQVLWHARQDIAPNTGEPPICAVPDEIQSAFIGLPFSIDLVASDPDGRITGIEAVNLPMWATLSMLTELPAADAVARISGIPMPEDAGLHVMTIVATDNDGNNTANVLKIKVADYGFTDEPPGVA